MNDLYKEAKEHLGAPYGMLENEPLIVDTQLHPDAAYEPLREWMEANNREHILNCAKEIKKFCVSHKCEECLFFQVNDVGFGDCKIWCTCLPSEWDID